MNVAKYQLPTITCNHSQSASILEILIHTILFQRTIGIRVAPKDIESYLFDDLEYVAINDDQILNDVKHRIIGLCEIREGNTLPITLSLYYIVKKYGILGEYDEKIEFERWSIQLQYVMEKTFAEENTLEKEIRMAMDAILSVEEIPLQMPTYEKFSFAINNSTPRQNGMMYDMFASASRMFSTP